MWPEWTATAVAALVVVSAATTLTVASRRRHPVDGDAQVRRIRVNGGYDPAEVHVRAGWPCRLVFHREESATCSERVVFPDFGISVDLPPFGDVAIDLPPGAPGVHAFTCEMRMLRGTLVVDEAAAQRPHQRELGGR